MWLKIGVACGDECLGITPREPHLIGLGCGLNERQSPGCNAALY